MTDAERLDWLADQLPFDGFAGLDLHEIASEWVGLEGMDDLTPAEERAAYRWAMRELIDRASVEQDQVKK